MSSRKGSHGSCSQSAGSNAIVSRLAQQDKTPWYKKPNLRLLYLLMFPACISVQMTTGFDASMLNGLQASPSWLEYYHHPRSDSLGLMFATYPLGGMLTIPFVPFIVDKFGRRYSILIGGITVLIGGALQGAALNSTMFILARFIMGLGVVPAIVAASSLIGELSHPKERATISSIFSSGYMVGATIAAGVTLATFSIPGDWGWRVPTSLEVFPSLLQLSFIWFLPESPRWLISKGRGSEAYAVLVKYHAEGNENSEFVKAEYDQIRETLAEELENAQMSWKEIFSTTGMRRRVVIASFLGLAIKWSGMGLISYFLSPILDDVGIHDNQTKNIINLVWCGWDLISGTFLAFIAPRYPRRKMFLASTTSLLIILVAWTAASAEYALNRSPVFSYVVILLVFLHAVAYNIGVSALTYTFLIEIFPYHMRARGITIFQWWSRVAGFVALFIDPIGIEAAGWRYYLIYCMWIGFEVAFVYAMFPETSGRTLEELTFLFEGGYGQDPEIPRIAEVEPLLQGDLQVYEEYKQ